VNERHRSEAETDVLALAAAWAREGRKVALATVVETWGSSPCPVGSQLVVDEKGRFEGSVSGGCVEAAVVEEALGTMKRGLPKTVKYGVTADRAWEVGLPCGGRIVVFIEPVL
jgi:xanthine dehydrogenase accessory factor